MTEEQFRAIRERCDRATPPPWVADEKGYDVSLGYTPECGRTHGYGCGNNFVCSLNDGEYHEYYDESEQRANAEFIAHARQDVVCLLAEVERLQAESQRWERAANWLANILEEHKDFCPLRFSIENCETSMVPKVDGCEGAWPIRDHYHCLTHVRVNKCWVKAAIKATIQEPRKARIGEMPEDELSRLEELAEKAKKGPWKARTVHIAEGYYGGVNDADGGTLVAVDAFFCPECGEFVGETGIEDKEDAEYIAAANPATILSLIRELRSCRKLLRVYEQQ